MPVRPGTAAAAQSDELRSTKFIHDAPSYRKLNISKEIIVRGIAPSQRLAAFAECWGCRNLL